MRSLRLYQETIFFLLLILFLFGVSFSSIEWSPPASYPLTVVRAEPQEDGGYFAVSP